jgi:cytochrome c oxidase cbb3-type subunit III
MKYRKAILFIALCVAVQPAFAEDDHSLLTPETQNYIGYGAIVFTLLLFIVAMLVLLRTLNILTRVVLKYKGYTDAEIAAEMNPAKKEKKPKSDVWIKLLSLKPLSEEKDLLIEHDYDGIQELDNPIPAWFMYLFYGTIVFGVCYLLNYHVFHFGQLQYEEYKTEMVQADIAKKEFLAKSANQVDENTVKLVKAPAILASGKAVFLQNCQACHGPQAQGLVGPNLTDDYWLHGNKINDLFKTIKYGVLTKGMPTWEKLLSPKQISDVANYVKSLHGTNPPNPKAPQGDKETDDTAQSLKKSSAIASIK